MNRNTEVLNSQLSTYTRNATAADVPLCPLCRTELAPDSSHCRSCQRLLTVPGAVPDRVGFGIYAVGERQTGYMMRNYKSGVPNRDYRQVRALITEMLQHNACLAALNGTPVSAITYIPSLSHPSHHYTRSRIFLETWCGPFQLSLSSPVSTFSRLLSRTRPTR